jgi:GNAT superfamily N-acetyltransferase
LTLSIRSAAPDDAALIHRFIGELAQYEKLADKAVATVGQIEAALFGDPVRAYAHIAELDGVAVGFALWFYNFSTFEGRAGIYLEDLYVRPQARGAGAGKALLAALAERCVAEGLPRLEWAVLDWNAPAIAFYDSLNAEAKTEWITRRLSGDALARLADAKARRASI